MLDFEQEIVKMIKQIEDSINLSLERAFKRQGLTLAQGGLLILLYKMGDLKISEISSILQKGNNTISQLCDRLEKLSLVKRIKDLDDKRIVYVHLEDEARIKIEDIAKIETSNIKFSKSDEEIIMNGLKCLLKCVTGDNNE